MEPRGVAGLEDLEMLVLLGEPTRRRLYRFVVESDHSVSRDECAKATGVDRSLVAYHLDRLLEHGLLEARYERPPGRPGPGAGRPPKLYRRADREFALRAPPRDYRLLAELVVAAAEAGADEVAEAIERVAGEFGRSLGEAAREAGDRPQELLRKQGYEPFEAEPNLVRLRNCPFDSVASRYPETVCRLNRALIAGILSGLGSDRDRAMPSPQEGICCVAIRTASRRSAGSEDRAWRGVRGRSARP